MQLNLLKIFNFFILFGVLSCTTTPKRIYRKKFPVRVLSEEDVLRMRALEKYRRLRLENKKEKVIQKQKFISRPPKKNNRDPENISIEIEQLSDFFCIKYASKFQNKKDCQFFVQEKKDLCLKNYTKNNSQYPSCLKQYLKSPP